VGFAVVVGVGVAVADFSIVIDAVGDLVSLMELDRVGVVETDGQ